MKKQFIYKITLLFSVIMVLFCIKSYAVSSNFTYKLDSNNYASITSYKGTSGNVTIPSTIDGYKVKTIANHAFNESRNDTNGKVLTNVIISEGITKIGDFAFNDCTNLESVTVPESITDLGFQTFIGCGKLTNINIPSKVTKLQSMIFQDTGFTEFEVPETIEEMNSSFRSCDNLKKVVIYNKNLSYYLTLPSGQVVDTTPFEFCSSDLILYSYKGSTTEEYAKEKGFIFKDIETLSSDTQVDISVENVTLNKQSLSLYIGEKETITATILPENATNKSIIWSSDNKNVVTVENGKIIAISEGVAKITAITVDGNHVATCEVTVKKDIEEPTENKGEEVPPEDNDKELPSENKDETDESITQQEIHKERNNIDFIILIILVIILVIGVKVFLKIYKDIN